MRYRKNAIDELKRCLSVCLYVCMWLETADFSEFGATNLLCSSLYENNDFGAFLGLRGVSPTTESKTLAFQVRVEAIAVFPLACMEKVNIHEN